LASSWSHSKTARSLAVAIGTRRVLRLFVVSPRNVIGATSEVHVLEPKRKHLALAHARVERGDDHRPQERRCDREESRFLALGDSPATLIVLTQLADQRLCSASERRPIDVLATDGPIHHVTQDLDRAVN
jgi:hypothetical protein